MSMIPLRTQRRAWLDGVEQAGMYLDGQRVWSKAIPISELYGVGPGQIPMDHKYALGTASGGNVTAVPNSGGAGAAFNLTAVGSIPVTDNYVTMTREVYMNLASRAEFLGTRLFVVADLLGLELNQVFAGSGTTGDRSNVTLAAGGVRMTINSDLGSGFVNAQVPLDPVVTLGLRIFEIEAQSNGTCAVFVNGQQRGRTTSALTSVGVRRIGAGQNTATGLNAKLYRSLSIITGGDYAARVPMIRTQLAAQYGITL